MRDKNNELLLHDNMTSRKCLMRKQLANMPFGVCWDAGELFIAHASAGGYNSFADKALHAARQMLRKCVQDSEQVHGAGQSNLRSDPSGTSSKTAPHAVLSIEFERAMSQSSDAFKL